MSEATSKEQQKIVQLYGALWACIILTCIPDVSFAIVATILFIILLITTYIVKKRSDEKSLTYNHTTYIIRGLWFGIFILPAVTVTIATLYLLPNYDPSVMNICAQPLAEHILNNPDDTDIRRLYAFIAPCMDGFMKDNMQVFLTAAIIAGTPIILYFLVRFGKGTLLALKGTPLEKPKSWIA
ncbi:MAG: hypothetical protein HRT94_06350 [Alphaproteobacteria bacterium]|nr:hypothetical protein [Alphaproteobacteria bacterium]